MSFKLLKQFDGMDCGPTCLRMVAKHFGRNFKQQSINKMCQINREGVSLLGISDAAEKIGFRNNTLKNKNYFVPAKEIVCSFSFN